MRYLLLEISICFQQLGDLVRPRSSCRSGFRRGIRCGNRSGFVNLCGRGFRIRCRTRNGDRGRYWGFLCERDNFIMCKASLHKL